MCLHSVKCEPESTLGVVLVILLKKITCCHVTEEPKITHSVVSPSHSPFKKKQQQKKMAYFLSRWSSDLWPNTPSPRQQKQIFSLRLSVTLEIFSGQYSLCCCSCSALWGICGPALVTRPNWARPPTPPPLPSPNQPTSAVYRLCERSLGTFACCPAQRKTSKSPLYCSVPDVRTYACMYVRVRGSVCEYLKKKNKHHHLMWGRKQNGREFNHDAHRRQRRESRSMQWILFEKNLRSRRHVRNNVEGSHSHCWSLLS